MTRIYTPLHYAAGIIGGLALIVDIWTNVADLYEKTGTYFESTIFAVIVIGIANAIALACAVKALMEVRIVTAAFLGLAVLLGSSFSILTTLNRTSYQHDMGIRKVLMENPTYQATVSEINANVIDQNTGAACGYRPGDLCNALRTRQAQLEDQKADMEESADAGAVRVASLLNDTLGWLFGSFSVKKVSIYLPMFLPAALFLFANWMLEFAVAGSPAPEFKTQTVGRSALEDKARRFAIQFQAANNRLPKPQEIEANLGVSYQVARRLCKVIA